MSLKNLDLASLEKQYRLPTGLLSAVQAAESGGNPNAVSPKGALGAFQFMPATAKQYGINPLDPNQAAVGAARMYADLSKKYNGDVPSMLAGYNWGQGNVDRKGLQNAPKETRDYIAKIMPKLGTEYASSGEIMNDGAQSDPELESLKAELAALEGNQPEQADPELAALQAEYEALTKAQPKETQFAEKSPLRSFGQSLGKGASFGLLDEAVAGIMTPFLKEKDQTYGQAYEQLLADARSSQSQSEATNPASSIAGEIVGAIPSAIAGAGAAGSALAKLSPKLAQSIGAYGAANPIKSGAGVGALQGALYGFGTGEGSAGARGENALLGLAIGGAAGGVTAGVAQNVVKPIVSKIGERLGRSAAAPIKAGTIDPNVPVLPQPAQAVSALQSLAPEENFIPALSQKGGELFSKTKGQRTQNAELQRLENSAVAGNLSPAANQAAKDAMTLQNEQFKGLLNKIAGKTEDTKDVGSILDGVVDIIKTSADDSWGGVNNAYALARQGGGVKIGVDDVRQGLFKSIGGLRRENQFDVSQMPQAKNVIKRLARYSKDAGGGRISAVKLGELESWRTMATTAAKNAQGSEKTFLSGMVRKYDDFMEKTAREAVDIGDAEAINAFKNAVSSRRNYGTLFEKNKLVNSIVEEGKGVDDVVKDLIGAGKIGGKRQMADNLDAILGAARGESLVVKSDLQLAFAKKIMNQAESGFAPDSQTPMLSPAKLKTALQDVFINQREFATKLYGRQNVEMAEKAIKELALISQKQAKVGSSSGTGEMNDALFKKISSLSKIPFLNEITESYSKTRAGNQVIKGLEEFKNPALTPKSTWFSRNAESISASGSALANTLAQPNKPLKITVRPESQLPPITQP